MVTEYFLHLAAAFVRSKLLYNKNAPMQALLFSKSLYELVDDEMEALHEYTF